jgi:tRNA-splicing ligase RtcB
MGTRTYVVSGMGSEASWASSSHGAGRRMSRSAARRTFTASDLRQAMIGKTWLEDRAGSLVDEIPASYKDIDQVMADQVDLVTVERTLRQVLNYKGT